jgi:hypothetical protein
VVCLRTLSTIKVSILVLEDTEIILDPEPYNINICINLSNIVWCCKLAFRHICASAMHVLVICLFIYYKTVVSCHAVLISMLLFYMVTYVCPLPAEKFFAVPKRSIP